MESRRSFLYLIVSDYPYGFGEPFLEDELAVIAGKFEKVYLILPEKFNASKERPKYKVPENAELIELNIQPGIAEKLLALTSWFRQSWRMERHFIRQVYKQPLDAFHIRVMLAYQALANAFEKEMTQLLEQHAHPKEQIVIYSYWMTYFTLGMGQLKKQFPRLRAVTRIHGWDCFFHVNPGNYMPFRPWLATTLDGIHPISEAGAAYTRNMLPGIDPTKIRAFRLGIAPLPQPGISTKKPKTLRILSLAFISPIKRIDRMIEAMAETQDCTIEWTHIGSAPMNEPGIQELAYEKLQPLPHITYRFAGELNKEQIYTFLSAQKIDILLCTSQSEGIPVSMMEALGHGIPIVSVNVGGISEIVNNGVNGELLPALATSSEIAQCLHRWAALSENEFQPISDRAYASYLQYFSALKNYTQFFSEVLNA